MKNQLQRIKELINYKFDGSFIMEEMEVSDNFKNNNFIEQKNIRSIVLEVGSDPENDIEHRIVLILSFTYRDRYEQLVFAFSLLDKNNQFVKGKESIYDKNIANQYLPKELQKNIVFFGKLKEMFKILITMEKPIEFYIETYEDYKNEKLLLPYNKIIDLILQNGYMLESKGLTHDKKKYYWKFVQKTKQQLKESKEFDDWYKNFKKDDEYWQHRKELTMEAVRGFIKIENEQKKNII